MRFLLPVAALLALLALVGPGLAQSRGDPVAAARAAITEMEQAGEALAEAERARDRVAALTQTVRAYEAGLDAIREGLRRANIREAAISGVFEAERDRLAQLVGVLLTIEATPAPASLVHPDGPLGSARAGMILSEMTPALGREVDTLRASLQEVALLRALQETAAGVLEDGLKGAEAARAELSRAVSERGELPRRFSADPEAMAALIASAETLEGFASGLMSVETTAGAAPATLPDDDFTARKGALALPVLGRVLRRFDEADAAGIARPGLILATRPLALVTAPAPSTIRYAGPLLDYGEVVVLEPGAGYLIVLAGLGQVFGAAGEVVQQRAALGLMGGAAPVSQDFLISIREGGQTDHSETLYIEIRQDGTPVNPEQWFAVNKE